MRLPTRRRGVVAPAILLAAATVTAVTVGATNTPAAAAVANPCTATYTVAWQTPSNSPPDFGVTITITNTATYGITNWTASFDYTAGQALIPGTAFSANVTQHGTTVQATPAGSFNANLAPGTSTSFGFNATFDGTHNPIPTLTCVGPSQGTSSATLSGALDPLGINTAAWDTNFVDPSIASQMSAAKVGLVRYPGGSWADQYQFGTNTVAGAVQPVNYGQFSSQVDAVSGGQKFNTIDYGSDTPQTAADWVKQSQAAGQGAALWEIGNEEYGSWEVDNHAAPHTATSYATNALPYLQAMKAVDPKAQICYDYAMDGGLAPGAGVDGWQNWDDTILKADAADIDCADVHWYPINGTPTESVQSIMELVDNIPAAAAEIHGELSTNDPSDYFLVGETNMSQTANEWNEEPVGALFAAANTMEWLSFGAQSVDWWDVHNYGSPTADFGMFSSGSTGEPTVDTPYPPYFGYQLAAKLAVKGATVGTLDLGIPNVYSYTSRQPDGSYAVMLVNGDPTTTVPVSASSIGITGAATQYTYDNANPSVVQGSFSGTTLTLPAESIVVLTTGTAPPPPTTTVAAPPPTTTVAAPPTTTTAAAPPTTTTAAAPPAGSGCSASWTVFSSWPGGFQLNFTVTNQGTTPTNGWQVGFTWPGAQTITQIWSASETQTGADVRVTNASFDGTVGPGGTTTFGFLGSGAPPTSLPTVTCGVT
ncbi:MAG TPA: cellulose binding domain-containing protein [Pseudonocardiaceae bacterium]|jgi:hypothetical protein